MVEIKVKVPKANNAEVVALADLGDNLEDAVAKFGAEVIFSNYQANAKITAQGRMRSMKEKGKTDDEIIAAIAEFKPGVASERTIDPIAMILGKAAKMDDAEVEDLIAKIKAKKGLV